MNIQEIFKNAKNDPDCVSNINIEEILNAIENKNTDYLDNKTFKTINKEIFDAFNSLGCDKEKLQYFCKQLTGFRLINELYELHKGKCIKTIRIINKETGEPICYDYNSPEKQDIVLKNFGVVTNIFFSDTNTFVNCIIFHPTRFFKYTFDHFLTFQKLSYEEQLILIANDHIEKIENFKNTIDTSFDSKQESSNPNIRKIKLLYKNPQSKPSNHLYYNPTLYDISNSDLFNYDPTQYDPTLYDPTLYDPTLYDMSFYDPTISNL